MDKCFVEKPFAVVWSDGGDEMFESFATICAAKRWCDTRNAEADKNPRIGRGFLTTTAEALEDGCEPV